MRLYWLPNWTVWRLHLVELSWDVKHPYTDPEVIPTSSVNSEGKPLEHECVSFSAVFQPPSDNDTTVSFPCGGRSGLLTSSVLGKCTLLPLLNITKKIKDCFHSTVMDGRTFRLRSVTTYQMHVSDSWRCSQMYEWDDLVIRRSLWICRSRIQETSKPRIWQGV